MKKCITILIVLLVVACSKVETNKTKDKYLITYTNGDTEIVYTSNQAAYLDHGCFSCFMEYNIRCGVRKFQLLK